MNKVLSIAIAALFLPTIASANVLRYHWGKNETLSLNTETHAAHLNATCVINAAMGNVTIANLAGPYQIHGNRLEISQQTSYESGGYGQHSVIKKAMVHLFFQKTTNGGWVEIPPYPSHKLLGEFEGSGCGFMLNPSSVAYLHKKGKSPVTFVPNK